MSTSHRADLRALRAYETIAPAYDSFTAHHKYEHLMGELLPALEACGLAGNRLLDVACGTGKSFLPMLARGWKVTACDISPAMAGLARKKAGGAARVEVADMRRLPVFGEFHLIWALADAVNYLLDPEELSSTLRGMRDNLAPTGLLLFDVNTMLAYRIFFATDETIELGDTCFRRRSLSSADAPPGSLWKAEFEAKGRERQVTPHVHCQRHFPEKDVLATLSCSGLEILDVAGQHVKGIGLQRPLDESKHTKAVYIARPLRAS